MEGVKKTASPQRPRGPSTIDNPQLAREHGVAAHVQPKSYAGSSRSSLFGLFRRQPQRQASRASLRPPKTSTGTHNVANVSASSASSVSRGHPYGESLNDSFFGAFDNISFDISSTSLESPEEVHATGHKVERMLAAAAKYRKAMDALSEASAEFGSTLYECANTKGASTASASKTPKSAPSSAGAASMSATERDGVDFGPDDHRVGADLQASGGLHQLISNHANLLARSLERQLEAPVREDHHEFKRRLHAKESEFRTALRAKMLALRQADEQRGRDSRRHRGRSTNRDLLAYRTTLLDLTSQIDDINRLKFEFLGDLHSLTTDLAESLHSAMASSVTAEIEVFESIARKGWSGGGLDGLLAGCPDPFSAPPPPQQPRPLLPRQQNTGLRSQTSLAASDGAFDDDVGGDHEAAEDEVEDEVDVDVEDGAQEAQVNHEKAGGDEPRKTHIAASAPTTPATETAKKPAVAGDNTAYPRTPPKAVRSAPAAGSAERNLFSIIPQRPLIPRPPHEDAAREGSSGSDEHDRSSRAGSPASSSSSELANLTLTPLKVNSGDESDY